MQIEHHYTVEYLFNHEPRAHEFKLKQSNLAVHEAAMHLLQLHIGDGENSLIMPTADSTPDEILAKADLVGIAEINVLNRPQ